MKRKLPFSDNKMVHNYPQFSADMAFAVVVEFLPVNDLVAICLSYLPPRFTGELDAVLGGHTEGNYTTLRIFNTCLF
jgi:hypothetical protein